MSKTKSGFTIVELLIVILVIGILAAITIVAYNGIQQRARNTQTINAVTAWAKAFRMYEVDNDDMPYMSGCLGSTYPYGPSGTDSTGFQCRQDNATVGIVVNSTLNDLAAKYIGGNGGNFPQPAAATFTNSATSWYRGAYFYSTTPRRIDYVLDGNLSSCPSIAGMTIQSRSYSSASNTTLCINRFE